MALNDTQLAALKAAIQADSALATAYAEGSDSVVAAAFNVLSVPEFWVWRTRVTKVEYTQQISIDNTTFTWTGNGFITRAQGERDAWRELFGEQGWVNPALPNVRQAFSDIFSGTGAALGNRTHMATMSRRRATRAERLYATGTGTTADPGTMTFEGAIPHEDVSATRNLP